MNANIDISRKIKNWRKSIYLVGLLLAGFFTTPTIANAQVIPGEIYNITNRTSNRIGCLTISAIEQHISKLTKASDIQDIRTNPNTEGCMWISGKGQIPLSKPAGWKKSGEYLFLVNVVALTDGRILLHPSVVVNNDEWRLQDECSSVGFDKIKLTTGESSRFFGATRRTGFDDYCLNLVNRKIEADELNAPPVIYSSVWKSRPYFRTMISCQNLDGMIKSLDTVINEQQVNRSDRATFPINNRCSFRTVDEIVASRFLGIYKTYNSANPEKSFFVEIHQVMHINRRTGIIDSSFMPTTPVRADLRSLDSRCAHQELIPNSGGISVSLYGTSIQNTQPVVFKTPNGEQMIRALTNTPVGNPACELKEIVFRRR